VFGLKDYLVLMEVGSSVVNTSSRVRGVCGDSSEGHSHVPVVNSNVICLLQTW